MKKFLRILAISIVLIVLAFYFLAIPKFVSLITDYDRYTFEYVTSNPEMVENYGIGSNRNPADYGFPNYEEIDYETLTDGLALNGWYVPASKEGIKQTLMINHGRTSNRLKTMKYLALVKEQGLDSLYNIFIPDLRNSNVHSASSLLECFLISCLQLGQIPGCSSTNSSLTCFIQHSINSAVECDSIASLHVGHSIIFQVLLSKFLTYNIYFIFQKLWYEYIRKISK